MAASGHPFRMRRRGVYLAVWLAMTAICWQPRASAARNGALPPDLKPMLEHLAIVSEMMHVCGHMRPDLAPQLYDAWTAWQLRNARVPEILDALRQDAAGANSEEGAPAGPGIATSPAKAREFVMGYEALRQTLQYQVEDQLRTGNMKLVRNCDNVLAKFTSGRLDYHPSAK
jgi:hypothetical protein